MDFSPLKNAAYASLTLLEAIRHSFFSQLVYFLGILLTFAFGMGTGPGTS